MELFNLEHALHRSKIFADGQINLVSLRQDISQNLYIYIVDSRYIIISAILIRFSSFRTIHSCSNSPSSQFRTHPYKTTQSCLLVCHFNFFNFFFIFINLYIFIDEANCITKLRELDKLSQSSHISWAETQSQAPEERGLLARQKRNLLLSSGVQLCSQETLQQAIASHLKYYQLRGENSVGCLDRYPFILCLDYCSEQ